VLPALPIILAFRSLRMWRQGQQIDADAAPASPGRECCCSGDPFF
jgi:hypothetical protein